MIHSPHGHIELIIGPMFAGKTTELMRRVRRELFARRSCYIIKHSRDVRYNRESVSSHDRLLLGATAAVAVLADVGDAWQSYDVVAVDEGQFFPDVVDFCSRAADAGKTVIVSALDGDYRRQPFDGICSLIPLAESVKKLSAVCMVCHERDASFTHRTVSCSARELIGGADMYIAACRMCYIEKEKEQHSIVAAAAAEKEKKMEEQPQSCGDVEDRNMPQEKPQQRKEEKAEKQRDAVGEEPTTPEFNTAAAMESPSPAVMSRKRPSDAVDDNTSIDAEHRAGVRARVEFQ
ncbi:putative thymidine kinase [Trypanosoma theileri]|uniref:Thymidine kinase n=1 Tax=Trypanosoma theileri TaxID=67003 RepID=A0A1X0NYI8_9TRYP|nr:putative thymidine kinase [Trypanosoma theileri]ORC89533.1 putative thymidine kinase [Trypanosoma theileri]